MAALDRVLPVYDVRRRHEILVPCPPERAVAAALAVPAAPDSIVKVLFRLRGLPARASVADLIEAMRFETLVRSDTEVVIGCSGTPWRRHGGIRPLAEAAPGSVRIAADFRAEAFGSGCRLSTETRVAAVDEHARRAFARYWRVVGPFSSVVRRRWLAAVARAVG